MNTPATNPSAAASARQSADVTVIVTSGDTEWRGTFAHFVADNKDGLTLHDIETICAVLEVGGTYNGGGGAEASYTIRLAGKEDRNNHFHQAAPKKGRSRS